MSIRCPECRHPLSEKGRPEITYHTPGDDGLQLTKVTRTHECLNCPVVVKHVQTFKQTDTSVYTTECG